MTVNVIPAKRKHVSAVTVKVSACCAGLWSVTGCSHTWMQKAGAASAELAFQCVSVFYHHCFLVPYYAPPCSRCFTTVKLDKCV